MLEKQVDVCVGRDQNGERTRPWGRIHHSEGGGSGGGEEKKRRGVGVMEILKPTPPPGV